jgi:hypothetical protein
VRMAPGLVNGEFRWKIFLTKLEGGSLADHPLHAS